MEAIVSQYARARQRLLLLDYDGTLRDFALRPELATPTSELKKLLANLVADKKNTIVIISGRSHEVLDDWLGNLPLHFIAEHGMAYRSPGESWRFADAAPTDWQAPVRKIMEQATVAVPGSLIEAKMNSLVWHYRPAEASPDVALTALLDGLAPLVKQHKLRIFHGEKSRAVDVQPAGTDKGNSTQRWFNVNDYDFILAAGDDITDEDLFRAMPSHAFTIKVGSDESVATDRLASPLEVYGLLESLVAADSRV